ncbi:hypothetical protein PENFLA_c013G06131 [Penicillium flavigenum]|uniref:Uncharacterized protein n=1 Tax=Penicillium flavigenum TaxID=254877 RepID=A0A1V6T8H8_9EURO|nr:hypothetical protein PENFLA_c013G06131 [Penicillium flavigenum]
MERRKPAATPENYARAIISLSGRFQSTSVFPGNNYLDLKGWMVQDRRIFKSARLEDDESDFASIFASKSDQPHDLVVVYSSDGEKKWNVQQYNQEQHEDFYSETSIPAEGAGQMVFIRGYISPSWVSVLGSKYNIDPEFFRRHMDYLSGSIFRHSFGFPSLASSSNNIFKLCVSTLLHRDDFGGQDLQSQRSDQATELKTYKQRQLAFTKVCCGDSLVREYSTVCSSFSVIEQWISLCVAKADKGWTVIAWMDQGRPLEQSPPGPWTSHIKSNATPFPILQHHPKMAFRNTSNRLDPGANASAELPQSTAILPLQYDSLIALVDLARRAPRDPLSMCIPLFTHTAFSEVQFLNLIESRIQIQINTTTEAVKADELGTLQYFYNILNRHAQQLKDSTRALYKLAEQSNNQGLYAVPPGLGTGISRRASEAKTIKNLGANSSGGAFTIKGLLEDYEELHVRCIDLSKMCTRGITMAMNKATIEESRKAIEQSKRLKKLTLLATLFIPLNFSSSMMGMNIDLLGQNTVRFWWFLVLCIPVTLFAYCFFLWDFQYVKRGWAKFWTSCCGVGRGMPASSSEKDPSHIV